MSDAIEVLPCLIIPTGGRSVLLPNVSVAEIVDFQAPVGGHGAEGVLGTIHWRGLTLPVLAIEKVNGTDAGNPATNPRIAVINCIGDGRSKLPFFAITTANIPRLFKIASNALPELEGETGPATRCLVQIDEEVLDVPDLEYLEKVAASAL